MRDENRLRLAEAVIRATDVLNSHAGATFDQVMAGALGLVAEAIAADGVDIYRYTSVDKDMRLRKLYGWSKETGGARPAGVVSLPATGVVEALSRWLQSGRDVNVRRSGMTDDEKALADTYGVCSAFVAPIFMMGEFWGCVAFKDGAHDRLFDEDCADLLGSAARIAAAALTRMEVTKSMEDTFGFLKKSKDMADSLRKIATLFLSHQETNFKEIMEEEIQPVLNMLHIDIVSIWRHFAEPDDLYMSQIYRWDRDKSNAPALEFSRLDYAQYAPTWETLFTYTDAINSPADKIPDIMAAGILEAFGASSVFAPPVYINNKLWGFVLFADTHAERYFDEESAEMMRVAAFLFANAVMHEEEKTIIADEKERVRLMLDTSPLCIQLWDGEFNIIDCNEATLKLFGLTDKQELINRYFDFSPKYQSDGQLSWDKAVTGIQKALREGECIFIWMHQLPDGKPLPVEITLRRVQYRGYPIVVGYTRDLRAIAHLEARINRLEAEAEMIFHDPLTNLYNRRFVDENLRRMLKSLSRVEGALSVMMADIDYFKKYNDTYGHSAGDDCLRAVADILADAAERGDDFVARYGGEEFLIVLPNTSERGAMLIAEKILERVRAHTLPVGDGETASVTISIGVACGFAQPHLTETDYINMADKQLYASKQNGRDQYTCMRF